MTENNNTPATEKKPHSSNWVARICALLLAIILWFYVIRVDNPTFERIFDYVPINLSGTEEMLTQNGYSVISGYDGVVSVTLAGKQSEVNRMKNSDIIATVDVSAVNSPGSHMLPVSITAKNGFKVVSYEPTTLEVYVDATLQRDVECIPKISYSKEENFVLGECTTDPVLIKISGPRTVVESVHHAETNVDFGKVTKSMEAIGNVRLVDESGNIVTNPYLKMQTSAVEVHLPVYKQKYLTPVIRFTDDIIPAEYFTVTFEPDMIFVQGEASYVDAVSDKIVVNSIDPKQIAEKSTYEILLSSINDKLDYLNGETVTVEISLDESIRNNKKVIPIYLSESTIKINGSKNGASYIAISPDILYIEARSADSEALEKLTADDVTLTADFSTVSESGNYRRDIVVTFKSNKVFTSEKYSANFNVII